MSNSIAAERNLTLKHDSGEEEPVVVSVLVPYRIEQGDWRCDYKILGGSFQRAYHAIGIDSVQALTLAMASVKTDLDHIERKHKARFHFLDEVGHEFK